MPRTKSTKSGVLETVIEKQVAKAVKNAIKKENLATSENLKVLVKEIRSLKKGISGPARAKKAKTPIKKSRVGRKPSHKTCTVRGCNKPHYAKGLCASHYQKQRREQQVAPKKAKRKTGKRSAARKKTAKKK